MMLLFVCMCTTTHQSDITSEKYSFFSETLSSILFFTILLWGWLSAIRKVDGNIYRMKQNIRAFEDAQNFLQKIFIEIYSFKTPYVTV